MSLFCDLQYVLSRGQKVTGLVFESAPLSLFLGFELLSLHALLNCRFVSYLRCVAAQLLVACGCLMYVFEMCYLASMDAFMLVTSVAV